MHLTIVIGVVCNEKQESSIFFYLLSAIVGLSAYLAAKADSDSDLAQEFTNPVADFMTIP